MCLLVISEGNHRGYLDSFRARAPLALITLPKGKNRRLKIDNPIEFIMREREERTGENSHTPSMVTLNACYFGHYLKCRGQLLALYQLMFDSKWKKNYILTTQITLATESIQFWWALKPASH